ncbi:MAG: aspartate/glutamate racemase family protein, partial [Candidatus Marinimicrobia bacterium]|nr:aspartate/glutamate racemase family protein [Candidatus Neomarinimicrobiota bacterium]
YFYIDTENYPRCDPTLPIGIFDSGTGGLTVMDAIVNFDSFDNVTNILKMGGDGRRDFEKEWFIYLGDQANMPYGNYAAENNTELLLEHIIKDVQFLLGNKYYQTAKSPQFQDDKLPVKSIVIACNTATAFGKESIERFLREAKLDLKVIGVIGAGVRGAFSYISPDENCSIGIIATAGTVSSGGYVQAINQYINSAAREDNVSVFQQAGIGWAGAIDGSPEYISSTATRPYAEYRGPSFDHSAAVIDKNILARYDFNWGGNQLLYIGEPENPDTIQLNSVENYIRYHVVSLLEQLRKAEEPKPLKVIILGCTHYPFYKSQIKTQLQRLYNYKEDGQLVYRPFMNEDIILVDPAINTARELFEYLYENHLQNDSDIQNSEFYISVPNVTNSNVHLDGFGNFTYKYKYGRRAGNTQEYVKRVPFSRQTLNTEVVQRLSSGIPIVYQLIHGFNSSNTKMDYLSERDRL